MSAALRVVGRDLSKEARAVRPEARFALYSASSPATLGPDGRRVPRFSRRPVWLIRYAAIEGRRASPVVVRRARPGEAPPTTLDLRVVTDIFVIVDDATGTEVLRSEMMATSAPLP